MPTNSIIGSLNGGSSQRATIHPFPATLSPTESTVALNSQYVYGSTGNCYAFIFTPNEDGNLTDFWIKVASYTGTWGNTDGVINIEIRDGYNGLNKAGSSIITGGSFTITLDGSTTGWIKKTGLSISMTKGQLYTIVVCDTDSSAILGSHYATIVRANSSATPMLNSYAGNFTSTNGFSTGSTGSQSACFALKQNGTMYGGSNFSSASTLTNNTVERGIRFKIPDPMTIFGALSPESFISPAWTFNLYADGVNPGGSTLVSVTKPAWTVNGATLPNAAFIPFGSSGTYDLAANTWYRLVTKPSANSTVPRKFTVGGSPDADVLSCSLPFGGNCYHTIESGGAWVDDTSTGYGLAPVLVPKSQPTIVS